MGLQQAMGDSQFRLTVIPLAGPAGARILTADPRRWGMRFVASIGNMTVAPFQLLATTAFMGHSVPNTGLSEILKYADMLSTVQMEWYAWNPGPPATLVVHEYLYLR